MLRNILYIIASLFICIFLAFFQRVTGPTYPVKGEIKKDDIHFNYKFPRSCEIAQKKCVVKIESKRDLGFHLLYKRYKVDEDFKKIDFKMGDNHFFAMIDDQYKPASKIEYNVYYKVNNETFKINQKPIILRFKGKVNRFIIILHVFFMFLSLTLISYLFITALIEKKYSRVVFWINYLAMFLGGFILGPLLQKQAFGVWWSGFPFGYDMTDNKTLFSFLFWSYSAYQLYMKKDIRKYIIVSSIVSLISYLIPHSLFGSEYDYYKSELK